MTEPMGAARPDPATENVGGVAAAELKQFVERIERLAEEKQAVAEDVKEVYAEVKGRGYDTKAVRKIVSLRRKDAREREEEDAILDLYKNALGML